MSTLILAVDDKYQMEPWGAVTAPTTNKPPTVAITSPAAGATVTAGTQLPLVATALDDVGVTKLEFFNAAAQSLGLGVKNGNQYSLTITVPNVTGSFGITAKATDGGGKTDTATITVTIQAATTPVTKLDPPANLHQTAGTTSSVTMAWDAVDNATGYRLKVNGGTTYMPGTDTSYTITGLAAGSTPSIQVQALYGGSGPYSNSDYSTAVQAQVQTAANNASLVVNSTLLSQNVVVEDLGYVERVSPMSILEGLAITGSGPVVFTQYSDDSQLDMLNGYVQMDGGAPQYLTTNSSGKQTFTFQNPGGTHTWRYVGGSAQRPSEGGTGNVLTGGVLTKVDFAAGQTYALAAITKAPNAMFGLGDSIEVEVGASGVGKGWLSVLRGQLGPTWDVATDSYGYRGLLPSMMQASFLNDLKQRATTFFAGRSGRKLFVLDLGTNNYGLAPPLTSAADAATIAGTILDAMSSLGIEVALKTPISRYDKTGANSPYNNTLANYTTALLSLASSRSTVGFMDATNWTGQSDLSADRLHPSDQGHPLIAGQYFSFINRNVADTGVYNQRFYAGGTRYTLARNTQNIVMVNGFAIGVRFVPGANTGYQQLGAKASVDASIELPASNVQDGTFGVYTYQNAVHGSVYGPNGAVIDILLPGLVAGNDYIALFIYHPTTGAVLYLLAGGTITMVTGGTLSVLQNSTDAITFGAVRYINPPSVGSRFLGYLDRGTFFNRPLTDAEARAYLNAGGVTPSGLMSALAVDTDFKSTSGGTTARNTAIAASPLDIVQLGGTPATPPTETGPPATGTPSQPGTTTRANNPSYVPSDAVAFGQSGDNGGQAATNTFGATLTRTFTALGTKIDVLINRFPEGGNMTISFTGAPSRSASCLSGSINIAQVATTYNTVPGQQYTLSFTKADQAVRPSNSQPTFIVVAGDTQY